MKAALLGYGTVGKGADAVLAGSGVEVSRILARRPRPELGERLTLDMSDVLGDPDISVVAECIGGYEPAHGFLRASLEAGKSVVSSNKQMIARYLRELVSLARERELSIAFSGAVGGGIPWLVNLVRTAGADRITGLGGVMNGTTNFILNAMQGGGGDFADALAEAQRLGFAEADPSADIDGIDVRAKISISADLAFDVFLDPETVPVLGIRHITAADVANFRELGLVCRLIGRADRTDSGAAVYAEPMLFGAGSPEQSLPGAMNIISLEAERAGRMSFSGPGAGMGPTGSSVALDILDISRGRSAFDAISCQKVIENDTDGVLHRYYARGFSKLPFEAESRTGDAVITGPVSVSAMHAAVSAALEAGDRPFAASLAGR
jgi:homoserine dehydrogenase